MILCEWDAPEGDPGQSCVHLYARILSSSLTSVSIFSVSCYSIVSISMIYLFPARESLVSDIPAGDGKIAILFLQLEDLRTDKT
jgi:hypothetical protein